jgi:hypothetical protein
MFRQKDAVGQLESGGSLSILPLPPIQRWVVDESAEKYAWEGPRNWWDASPTVSVMGCDKHWLRPPPLYGTVSSGLHSVRHRLRSLAEALCSLQVGGQ